MRTVSLRPRAWPRCLGLPVHSRLYEGRVWHERTEPAYRFQHGVFYMSIDLEELDWIEKRLGIFGHNRQNVVSVYDSDYDGLSALKRIRDYNATSCGSGCTVSLLTMPRILGYAFNPVSFFLVRDSQGNLQHVLAEVHNTWGERHVYDLPRSGPSGTYRSHVAKAFYVSPLLDQQANYDFELEDGRDGRLRILVTESTASGPVLAAGMNLEPKELTRRNLVGSLFRYPLLTAKVILAIHWHAFRIWLRGAVFHGHSQVAPNRLDSTR